MGFETTDAVSVVIPTFNRASLLQRALDSVATQTWQGRLECVVVDNASSDATQTIVDRWAEANPQVDLVFRSWPNNVGPVENWRRGIELAHHEWIKILWSDDWLEANAISTLVQAATDSIADTVTCAAIIHVPGSTIRAYAEAAGVYGANEAARSLVGLGPGIPVSPAAALVRRSSALAGLALAPSLGICSERAIGPDLLLLYFGVFHGKTAVHVPQPLVHFWGGADSITMTSRGRDLSDCYSAAVYTLAREAGASLDDEAMRALQHRAALARLRRDPTAQLLPSPRFSIRRAAKSIRSRVTRPVR